MTTFTEMVNNLPCWV